MLTSFAGASKFSQGPEESPLHELEVLNVSYRYLNISWLTPQNNISDLTHFVINYQRKQLMKGKNLTRPISSQLFTVGRDD